MEFFKNLFGIGGATATATANSRAREFRGTTPTETRQAAPEPQSDDKNYLNAEVGWKSWFFTTDHKRIALLYMFSITGYFAIGGFAAALMRLNLATPHSALLRPQDYNKMFSLHGIIMIWFFLVPSIPTVLGNFLIPMMIGAKDLAFPKLNLISWYLFMLGGAITLWAMLTGGVDTGWTFYTPYSTMFSNSSVITALLGVIIAGFSSILTGLNFIVTIHKMRAPGMGWFRMPLFVWSHYATALILVLGTPVLTAVLVMVILERTLHIGIFDPKYNGDPLLFQHLFWFYSHPAVYIMLLPGMGIVSELISCFSRRRPFGYRFIAYATLGIATFGFLVWGHHMFVSGMSVYAGMIFSFLSFAVAIPSAIKVFNWTATLYKGRIILDTPMLYALGFIGLFVIGGMTGLFLASLAMDVHLTDTYFVVAHFHYIMVGASVTAYIGGLHFWWPKITGRMYPEHWGKVAAGLLFIGFNLTFFPQFLLGSRGMPRRYATYAPEFQSLNLLSTAGASILGFGYLLPLLYLPWAAFYGKRAGRDPWNATGLEWTTPSPPPTENFPQTPVVTEEAYAYHTREPDEESRYE